MARVRRWLVRVMWLGLAWALLLYLTGGFVISLGPLHASSRGTRNPLLLAALAMVLTWVLGPRGHRAAAFAAAWREALQALSLTIRFDEIPPSRLDAVVAMWRQRGYSTFIALDDWEALEFRSRFAGASRLGALDWPPETTAPGAVLYAAAPQR